MPSLASKWKDYVTGYNRNRARISNLAGVVGMNHLQAVASQHRKNMEAENRAARSYWNGQSSPDQVAAPETEEVNDSMRDTMLGDVITPPPVVVNNPPPQNNQMGTVLAALLGMLPLGGYLALESLKDERQPPPAVVQPAEYDDTTVEIGLGQIEDYE